MTKYSNVEIMSILIMAREQIRKKAYKDAECTISTLIGVFWYCQ